MSHELFIVPSECALRKKKMKKERREDGKLESYIVLDTCRIYTSQYTAHSTHSTAHSSQHIA